VDEQTGAMFARAYGMTVVALRLHWVATPTELRARVAAVARDPAVGRSARELWGYVHIADAVDACRAGLSAPTGWHAVNIAAPDTLSNLPTAELVARYHPRTDVRGLPGTASAWSCERARNVLGFAPARTWRAADYPEASA
jgi:nucleoside-diphosphate-sugar epimerase